MKYKFEDLVDILKRLRAEDGCPWDRAQDTHTLLPYLVEESSEFIDAALDEDKAHMCEELGDVLLQVVFHSQVCKESGDFNIDDVVQGICEKMVRRHPHVFGPEAGKPTTAKEIADTWELVKAKEKDPPQRREQVRYGQGKQEHAHARPYAGHYSQGGEGWF